MNTIFYLIIIGLTLFFFVSRMLPAKGVRQISTEELKDLMKKKNYEFIDVRTPHEFQSQHLRKFKNIPLMQLRKRHEELSKEKEIVVICQTGMRSNRATKILKRLGYTKLANVKGGILTWRG